MNDIISDTKCDQCGFIWKSINDLGVHTRREHIIFQLDGWIDSSKSKDFIEGDLKFQCGLCKYSSAEENNLWRHTERIHYQCGICDIKMNSEKSLKLHKKEKHCNQCGKVVKSFWHKKHIVKKDIYGDIYDVCGPECYVEFHNEVVDPPPPPGYTYGWFFAKWFWRGYLLPSPTLKYCNTFYCEKNISASQISLCMKLNKLN